MTEDRRPLHGRKDGSQLGLKEGGRGRNRNPDSCETDGPGHGEGKGRNKGGRRK